MPAKGFQIIGIEAKRHRKSGAQKQVRIDHNTNIVSVRKNNENELIVETRYTVSYGLLGIVQLDCEIRYHAGAKEIIQKSDAQWQKEHKLPDNIAEMIHNRVLAQGSFEVLNIAKKMNLPPPFKVEIPQIKIGKKGEMSNNNNSGPEVA